MKHVWSKKKILFTVFNLFLSLFLVRAASAEVKAPKGNDTITYGSTVRLVHMRTSKAVATGEIKYTHDKSSKQYAVWGEEVGDSSAQLWILKGPHGKDEQFEAGKNERWNAQLGRPMIKGTWLRLESVATGRNLHAQAGIPSPTTKQIEVAAFGANGIGDENDNFMLVQFKDNKTNAVLCNGSVVKFSHVNSKAELHSHPKQLVAPNELKDKQEITCYERGDENDWFEVQLVQTPAESAAKDDWEKLRQAGGTLNYNTLIVIDPLNTGIHTKFEKADLRRFIVSPGFNNRRLWTHAGSRLNAVEPGRYVELLAGPWSDGRTQREASWFILQNADNPGQEGSVNYGDKIRILSVFAAAGDKKRAGFASPAKVWWVNDDSRHGAAYNEIVISDADHVHAKDDQSIFVLESIFPRLASGPVYQTDAVQIRNMAFNQGVLWMNLNSRFDDRYYEILVNNNDDAWGLKKFENSRENIFNRFYLHHVAREWVPQDARDGFDKIIAEANLKKAEKALVDKEAEMAAQKAVFDTKLAEEQRKHDEAVIIATQLEDFASGFMGIPGEAQDIAIDFVERGKGKKRTSAFQAWAISEDGMLMKWMDSKWYMYPFDNKKAKSVSIADRAMYVVDENGNVWRHNRADAKLTPAPIFGKEAQTQVKKKKKKKKGKKSKKAKKSKKDKKDQKDKKDKKKEKKIKKKKGKKKLTKEERKARKEKRKQEKEAKAAAEASAEEASN